MTQDFRWIRDRGFNGHKEKENVHWGWASFAIIMVFMGSFIIAAWASTCIGDNNPHHILAILIIPIGTGVAAIYIRNNYKLTDS